MKILLFHIHILLFVSNICGQTQEVSLTQIRDTYQRLDYNQTIELTTLAISDYQVYDKDELVAIYRFRALSFYSLGNESEARNAFISLLSLSPGLNLDPVTISPKIIDYFENIKKENQYESDSLVIVETRYVQIEDPRPAAGWRSLILPGWGQIYKRERTKGYIIMSAFALNSAALITAIIKKNDAEDVYHSATYPEDIRTTYDEYDKWYQIAQYLTYTQVLIWGYAVGDAIWKPLPSTTLAITPLRINISYQF